MGIKSVKNKAYLQGQHAVLIASRNPVIDIQLPANDNIDNYIIVEMDDKGDRREIEMGSIGGTVGKRSAFAPTESCALLQPGWRSPFQNYNRERIEEG